MTVEKLNETQYAIIRELQKAVADLSGDIGIQAALGSWGDTLPEADVLQMLRDYNAASAKLPRQQHQHRSAA